MLTCGEGGSTGYEITTQINENTNAIATKAPFEYVMADPVLDITENYTEVASLSYPAMLSGIYIINLSTVYKLDVVQKRVFMQYIMEGNPAEEFSVEPNDNVNQKQFNYSFLYTHPNNVDFDFQLYMRKEDTDGVLDCLMANLWIEKRLELPVP